MRATVVLAAALLATGCSAALKFHECDKDSDCGNDADGGMLYCTDDHMCVSDTPDFELCSVSVPASGIIPDGAAIIGGLYRLDGANDVNDHAFRNAADLAATELNQIPGVSVAHVVCDTHGDPARAARGFKVLHDRWHVDIVVGPDTSDEVFEVVKEVKDVGVPFISPSATNPNITGKGYDNLVWRTAASDNLQAKVLGGLAPASTKLDIIYVSDSDYAMGLESAFTANFPAQQTVDVQGFKGGDTAGMMAAVAAVAKDAPNYLLMIADFDAPPLMAAVAGNSTFAMTQFLMTDSAKKPSLWGQLASTQYTMLSRLRGTGPANPAFGDPSGMAFQALSISYKNLYQEDPAETAFVSNTYDAFYTAAFAVASLSPSSRSAKNIVQRLGMMSDTTNGAKVVIGPNGVANAIATLQQGGTIDLVGTSGPIDFDPETGNILSAPIEVWSVDTTSATPTFKQDSIVVP